MVVVAFYSDTAGIFRLLVSNATDYGRQSYRAAGDKYRLIYVHNYVSPVVGTANQNVSSAIAEALTGNFSSATASALNK